MTSNLRRLSGAADLKIDIGDPMNANNSKYCNKKIKVNIHKHAANLICVSLRNSPEARPEKKNYDFFLVFNCFRMTTQRHSIHGMMEEENVIRPHQEIQRLSTEERKFLLNVERGDVAGTRR